MKTPWRFFADLVRRKSPDAALPGGLDGDPKALGLAHASPEIIPPESAREIPTKPWPPVPVADVVDADVTEIVQAKAGEGDAGALRAELTSTAAYVDEILAADGSVDEPTTSSPVERNETGEGELIGAAPDERQSVRIVLEEGAAPSKSTLVEPNAFSADSNVTVTDSMLELDEEIRHLRAELARKLAKQNDYIRKLLGRYDRPVR